MNGFFGKLMAKAQSKNIERNCFMIMHTASSGDQFGVNFNFNYVLLQIRETSEDFEGARMKLKIEDVDELIEMLQYYQTKLKLWKATVGDIREDESTEQYYSRALKVLKEHNYFISKQEE